MANSSSRTKNTSPNDTAKNTQRASPAKLPRSNQSGASGRDKAADMDKDNEDANTKDNDPSRKKPPRMARTGSPMNNPGAAPGRSKKQLRHAKSSGEMMVEGSTPAARRSEEGEADKPGGEDEILTFNGDESLFGVEKRITAGDRPRKGDMMERGRLAGKANLGQDEYSREELPVHSGRGNLYKGSDYYAPPEPDVYAEQGNIPPESVVYSRRRARS